MTEPHAPTASASTADVSEAQQSRFQELLEERLVPEIEARFRPQSAAAKQRIEAAVDVLSQHALRNVNLVSKSAINSVQEMIKQIDERISAQVREILRHPDFKKLEGAWRGLYYLVTNTETDEMLKIKVLNISKDELGDTLANYEGAAWDQSPVFRKLYTAEYSQFGGEPYGCLIGDYEFSQRPQDVTLLDNLAKVAAAAHCPFISAASPQLFQMESWQELMNPRDLTKITSSVEYASWNSLRGREDSRYICLTMPRVLARLPYGPNTLPVKEFDFDEDIEGGSHEHYTWMNSAYSMAVNINRSFKLYGWCSRIRGVESGGVVERLPVHTFPTDDGGVDMKCPAEIAIDDRREGELSKLGLLPLIHKKGTDLAAFIGAQTLQRPTEYDDADATANARLSARLPYVFATCRFAHYMKSLARDKIGSFKEQADMERFLTRWINNYVDGSPDISSEETKARKPLRAAKVVVDSDPENPGYYSARFYLRPHFQLEGLTASLRLVSRIERQA